MENRSFLMKALPWIIIAFSFLSLNKLPPALGWAGIIIGVVMLIERKWPEKWGDEK